MTANSHSLNKRKQKSDIKPKTGFLVYNSNTLDSYIVITYGSDYGYKKNMCGKHKDHFNKRKVKD